MTKRAYHESSFLNDKLCSGKCHPATTRFTNKNVKDVKKTHLTLDQRLSFSNYSKTININRKNVCRILTTNLNLK